MTLINFNSSCRIAWSCTAIDQSKCVFHCSYYIMGVDRTGEARVFTWELTGYYRARSENSHQNLNQLKIDDSRWECMRVFSTGAIICILVYQRCSTPVLWSGTWVFVSQGTLAVQNCNNFFQFKIVIIFFRSLKFWYIGSDGECVPNQDNAAVIIDGTVWNDFEQSLICLFFNSLIPSDFDILTAIDEITFGYLVKCRKSELDKAKVKYKLDTSR
jgi:hypothetical protein